MKNCIVALMAMMLLTNCQNNTKATAPTSIKKVGSKNVVAAKVDSIPIREMIPDYFEIPNQLYDKFTSGKNAKWFLSADGKMRLYFVPYTDGTITNAILTDSKLIDQEYRNVLASENIKIDEIEHAIPISKIETVQHLTIGSSLEQVIAVFGEPNKEIQTKSSKTLFWDFKMKDKPNYDFGTLKPFIEEGFEYNVKIIFENNQVKQLYYSYEIP